MLRRIPATLRHLLWVTLLGTPLITPLLRWTAVPCTHDGHLHYHRVAAMRHAWENGLYVSRWLPDLAFGYGYPFFIYRELPPLYAVLFPHLAGMPLPAASNLFYALCVLAGGWFMYLWVRDVLGARAGIVSAVAYMAAPYVLVDALIRGNSPESLALALMPFLLWTGRRWLLGATAVRGTAVSTAVYFLLSTFGMALFALSHNISLLIFTPTLLVYLLALSWLHRLPWPVWLGRIALLFGLGLGMTIFYAGGALLEMDQVTLQQSTTTRNNDFRFNFTTLSEIFAPAAPENPDLLNPPLPFRLGWVPTALALIGIAVGLWGSHRLPVNGNQLPVNSNQSPDPRPPAPGPRSPIKWHVALMALATAVYLFMSLPASRFIWEALPLIDFVQFPWRFVGRAALPVAFLAGAPFSLQPPAFSRQHNASRITFYVSRITFYAAIALLVIEAIPTLYPNVCDEEPFPTILTVHAYERETGLVGVDPEGSYFPRTVQRRPAGSPLEADYQRGVWPQRLDLAALPAGAEVRSVTYDNLSMTAVIDAPEPFTARYLTFAFPGWTATVNGSPAPITPGAPEGLITFPVPAGEHTIRVAWRATPLRTALTAVSLLALAAAIVVAVLLVRNRLPVITHQLSEISYQLPATDPRSPIADYRLLLLGLLLIGLKLAVDRVENPLRFSAPPPVSTQLALRGGELQLNGYNLSREAVPAGEVFDIDLAWTAVSPPTAQYQSNVWLQGPDGLVWSDRETFRPRLYEDAPDTRAWQPGQWGWDSREVAVFSGAPPGDYDIVVTLFDLATLAPLTLAAPDGGVLGPTAVIGQMTVTAAEDVAFTANPAFGVRVPQTGLRLLNARQDRAVAEPGNVLLLTLFWQRSSADAVDAFTIQLQDESGATAHEWPQATTRADFVNAWQIGQPVRGQYLLRLPAGLESGRYRLALAGEIVVGQIEVIAPARRFDPPPLETAVNADFFADERPLITLAGYTLQPITNNQLPITLVWQAQGETAVSYRVFVHLVDAAGQIVAQSDGEPANWARPTSGWAPGEYVTDAHTLTLPADPPANLTLRVGLYDPATGARLQSETADFVPIPLER